MNKEMKNVPWKCQSKVCSELIKELADGSELSQRHFPASGNVAGTRAGR